MIESHGLTPFYGFVENLLNPPVDGYVQVRVVGYNSPNPGILPTNALKWFPVVRDGASVNGVGRSATTFLVGTMVYGHYIDDDHQEGIILGSVAGNGDMSTLATGQGGVNLDSKRTGVVSGVPDGRGGTWSQPPIPYATVYPNNDVNVTQSGHVVEYDDTPGAERISIFHKSGTYEEIHPSGDQVNRVVGDSYEINTKDKMIIVNGDYKIYVNGDHYVNVAGEMYYKVGGGITFDTANTRTLGISEATDHISSNISGRDHIHAGVESGDGYTLVPVGATAGFFPTPANVFSLTTEDTGFTPQVAAEGLKNGYITPEDVQTQETYEPQVVAVDETPKPETPPVVVDCGEAIGTDGKINYSVLLAPGITLRSVSLGAVVSQYAIQDQVGLTKSQIICNLKNVAENVLVPLFKQYPNAMVTSGFRAGSGTSQHLRGEAVDIQFRGATKSDYYKVAQWVKANLPYDQLILEYKNFGTGQPWIHISLKRATKQRGQILTFFNHKKAADGLRDMS